MKKIYIPSLVLLISGCAATMEQTAFDKAAFDLNCAPEKIKIIDLGHRSYGATGCGKRISYKMRGECSIRSSCRAEKDAIGIE